MSVTRRFNTRLLYGMTMRTPHKSARPAKWARLQRADIPGVGASDWIGERRGRVKRRRSRLSHTNSQPSATCDRCQQSGGQRVWFHGWHRLVPEVDQILLHSPFHPSDWNPPRYADSPWLLEPGVYRTWSGIRSSSSLWLTNQRSLGSKKRWRDTDCFSTTSFKIRSD